MNDKDREDNLQRRLELPPGTGESAAQLYGGDSLLPTKLIQGDAINALQLIPDGIVNEIATSPPYYNQRDYRAAGQIGREHSVQEYLERLWEFFRQAWPKLTDDGLACVNLGDKYVDGCLQLIPSRFAIGMLERGWVLLNDITWHKTNGKPESVKCRFTTDSESIYIFAKSKSHYFNRLFEPYRSDPSKRDRRVVEQDDRCNPITPVKARSAKNLVVPGQTPHGMHLARLVGKGRDIYDPRGRNMRSVWSLPVGRCPDSHFAVWPAELARRLIMAGCPPGGTVLDPFVGSGTTMVVAIELGRRGIGIDINAEYLAIARENILRAIENQKRIAGFS